MQISKIGYSPLTKNTHFYAKTKKVNEPDLYSGMNGDKLVFDGNAAKYFKVAENLSNKKVGSKFILQSTLPQYKDLKILITPDSVIKSNDFKVQIKSNVEPSFKGRLYGSIRDDNGVVDSKMQTEYMRFWTTGMNDVINKRNIDKKYAPKIKDDYNFYIPTDGDGTRYKDITSLQGGVTKPASYIPAFMNGHQMSLVQGVISNFAMTGKLDKMYDFINVEPAKGSAFGFLEGLRKGQIPTDKPLVFSWGDNFSDINISRLMKNHEDKNSGFTVTVLPVDKNKTKALSIVKTDDVQSGKIDMFVEKPQDDDFIESCVLPEFGENKCLSAVGPYILSKEVLNWIKTNYVQNPQAFLNPTKGYDFSSMIISPMLEAFNKKEILDENGNPLEMKFDLIGEKETWSDLGSQVDFSKAMKEIKKGCYSNLPISMRNSIKENVDRTNNITFNPKSKQLFADLLKEINANAKNVIVYCQN